MMDEWWERLPWWAYILTGSTGLIIGLSEEVNRAVQEILPGWFVGPAMFLLVGVLCWCWAIIAMGIAALGDLFSEPVAKIFKIAAGLFLVSPLVWALLTVPNCSGDGGGYDPDDNPLVPNRYE